MDYVTGDLKQKLSWRQRLFVGMLIADGAAPDTGGGGGGNLELLMESGDHLLQESGHTIQIEH